MKISPLKVLSCFSLIEAGLLMIKAALILVFLDASFSVVSTDVVASIALAILSYVLIKQEHRINVAIGCSNPTQKNYTERFDTLIILLRFAAITLLVSSGFGLLYILGDSIVNSSMIDPVHPLICSAMGFTASALWVLTDSLTRKRLGKEVETLVDAIKQVENTLEKDNKEN
ncbi:hypothetical protein [Vibrio crassostreae]|uniref:hypothetical protein n=1 Tax=Vibrio crassostreae TaxID=246167 RepID=UPI001B30B38F|nr:hypothetical protein [Vibrio crassostreae]